VFHNDGAVERLVSKKRLGQVFWVKAIFSVNCPEIQNPRGRSRFFQMAQGPDFMVRHGLTGNNLAYCAEPVWAKAHIKLI
jgi:hypothetical protein